MIESLSGFFAIEGLDGSGTTTQAHLLAKELNGVFTCEPTTGKIGSLLRSYLSGENVVDKKTLALLFAADRCDHIYKEHGIFNLAVKQPVICDRYILSSYAYQSLDINSEFIETINESFFAPQLTIFVDTDVDVCMERLGKRSVKEIYETESLQRKIQELYYKGIEKYSQRGWNIEIINGNQAIEIINLEILKKIKKLLNMS